MIPKALPPLSEDAFEIFEKQDQMELSSEEKKFLRECLDIFKKNPIKF
jgi:hypothetical protein